MVARLRKPESMVYDEAKILDNFLRLHLDPVESEVIVVLGNNDNRTAVHGARLRLEDLAPVLLLSGGIGTRTIDRSQSEARRFERIIREKYPEIGEIILEEKATNTGENIRYSREKLEEQGIYPRKVLAVTKPYAERRIQASFVYQWPGLDSVVTVSPNYPFDDYFVGENSDTPLSISLKLIGEIDRLKKYSSPLYDHILPQDIPTEIDEVAESVRSRVVAVRDG